METNPSHVAAALTGAAPVMSCLYAPGRLKEINPRSQTHSEPAMCH